MSRKLIYPTKKGIKEVDFHIDENSKNLLSRLFRKEITYPYQLKIKTEDRTDFRTGVIRAQEELYKKQVLFTPILNKDNRKEIKIKGEKWETYPITEKQKIDLLNARDLLEETAIQEIPQADPVPYDYLSNLSIPQYSETKQKNQPNKPITFSEMWNSKYVRPVEESARERLRRYEELVKEEDQIDIILKEGIEEEINIDYCSIFESLREDYLLAISNFKEILYPLSALKDSQLNKSDVILRNPLVQKGRRMFSNLRLKARNLKHEYGEDVPLNFIRIPPEDLKIHATTVDTIESGLQKLWGDMNEYQNALSFIDEQSVKDYEKLIDFIDSIVDRQNKGSIVYRGDFTIYIRTKFKPFLYLDKEKTLKIRPDTKTVVLDSSNYIRIGSSQKIINNLDEFLKRIDSDHEFKFFRNYHDLPTVNKLS